MDQTIFGFIIVVFFGILMTALIILPPIVRNWRYGWLDNTIALQIEEAIKSFESTENGASIRVTIDESLDTTFCNMGEDDYYRRTTKTLTEDTCLCEYIQVILTLS